MRTATTARAASTAGTVLLIGALIAGCGSSSKSTGSSGSTTGAAGNTSSAPAPSAEKITLRLGLFGSFGYKEAGLYVAYEKLHPNITIKEDDTEQESDYYKALQTHLVASSGLDDIQAIEVGRI